MSDELLEQMKQSVIDGEVEDAERLAQEGLDAGMSAGDILDKGFVKGIEEVGDLFGRGEFFSQARSVYSLNSLRRKSRFDSGNLRLQYSFLIKQSAFRPR